MKRRRRVALVGVLAIAIVLLTGTAAFAADANTPYDSSLAGGSQIGVSLNMLWVVIGAVLVIFMQAGFALVETGFCRAKHAAHVVSTNFAVFGIGFVAFFLVGYSFMFGGYGTSLLGFAAPGKGLIGSGNWTFLWWSPPALGG